MFQPEPISILFHNSCRFTELTAIVETSERMRIGHTFKGSNLYAEKSGGFTDFSGFIFLFGLLLSTLYGHSVLQNNKYLKFLAQIDRTKKPFRYLIISRVLLLDAVFLLLNAISLLWLTVRGVSVNTDYFLVYIFVQILVVNFFFLLGTAIGTIKKRSSSYYALTAFFLLFVFIIPWTINKVVSKKADKITSVYELELRKLKTITGFENRAKKSQGDYTAEKGRTQEGRELIESFWNGEFLKLLEIENSMRKEMVELIQKCQLYSSFFPGSFYKSVCNELSSRGYNEFINYYRYVQEMTKGFMRWYLDVKYYSEQKKIESFIKGNENIYPAKSGLPSAFLLGVLMAAFFTAVSYILSCRGYKKLIEDEPGNLKDLPIDIKPGSLNFLLTGNQGLKNQVYNFFSGKGKTFVKVSVDGESLEKEGKGYVYRFDTKKMPEDITPPVLHKLLFGTRLQGEMENWEILFKFALIEAEKGKVILMDDFMNELKESEIKSMKQEVESRGLTVLYMSNRFFFGLQVADEPFISHPDDSSVEPKNSRNK